MTGKVSILHISDLHRSKGSEITNSALLASLVKDNDRYTTNETPIIKTPDLIIVSGDIIRGSISNDGSEIEIQGQYDEATEFLTRLTNQFLSGDKQRIIIVPGNHDVDWKFSKASMTKIDGNNVFDSVGKVKSEVLRESINQNTKIRWNWRDLSFYEITDLEKYNKRLEAFANFYSTFYDDKRVYSLNPSEQYDIFDFPTFKLTIVGFNSCFNNDHLRLVGDIHPACIGEASLKLRQYSEKGRLILATWHHNTKGLPFDSNYMDNSKLKNFIESSISVGFHGHQHKTELIHAYNDVIEKKKIIVFSAGTLCGGVNELPVGNNRQYNLIEIDWGKSSRTSIDVQLNIREKSDSSSFENPIWKQGRIDSVLVSHYTVQVDKPKQPNNSSVLIEVEGYLKKGQFSEGKQLLLTLDINEDFVRKYLADLIIATEDFELAIESFKLPRNESELIIILNAAIQLNKQEAFKNILRIAKDFESDSPAIKDFIKKIEALLK